MFLSDFSVIALATGIITSQAHNHLNFACSHMILPISSGNSQFPLQFKIFELFAIKNAFANVFYTLSISYNLNYFVRALEK